LNPGREALGESGVAFNKVGEMDVSVGEHRIYCTAFSFRRQESAWPGPYDTRSYLGCGGEKVDRKSVV
jgi:hypothetical protein